MLDLSGSVVSCCEQGKKEKGGNSDEYQRGVAFSRRWRMDAEQILNKLCTGASGKCYVTMLFRPS